MKYNKFKYGNTDTVKEFLNACKGLALDGYNVGELIVAFRKFKEKDMKKEEIKKEIDNLKCRIEELECELKKAEITCDIKDATTCPYWKEFCHGCSDCKYHNTLHIQFC